MHRRNYYADTTFNFPSKQAIIRQNRADIGPMQLRSNSGPILAHHDKFTYAALGPTYLSNAQLFCEIISGLT